MSAPIAGNSANNNPNNAISIFHPSRSTIGGVIRDKVIIKSEEKANNFIYDANCKIYHKVGGYSLKILDRGLGFIAMPSTRVVDAIMNALLFTLKSAFGLIASPINFAGKCITGDKIIKNGHWNFAEGRKHGVNSVMCTLDIFASPIIVLFDPKRLHHIYGDSKLQAQIDNLKGEKADLETEIANQETQIQNLEAQLNNLQQDAQAAGDEIQAAAINAVNIQIAQQAAIKELERGLEETNRALNELQEEANGNQEALAAQAGLRAQIETLQENLDQANTNLRQARDSANETLENNAFLRTQIDTLNNELTDLRTQNQNFAERIAHLERAQQELADVHNHALEQLETAKTNYLNLNEQKCAADKQLADINEMLDLAQKEIQDLKQANFAAGGDNKELLKQIEIKNKTIEELAGKEQKLSAQIANLTQRLAEVTRELAEAKQNLTVVHRRIQELDKAGEPIEVKTEEPILPIVKEEKAEEPIPNAIEGSLPQLPASSSAPVLPEGMAPPPVKLTGKALFDSNEQKRLKREHESRLTLNGFYLEGTKSGVDVDSLTKKIQNNKDTINILSKYAQGGDGDAAQKIQDLTEDTNSLDKEIKNSKILKFAFDRNRLKEILEKQFTTDELMLILGAYASHLSQNGPLDLEKTPNAFQPYLELLIQCAAFYNKSAERAIVDPCKTTYYSLFDQSPAKLVFVQLLQNRITNKLPSPIHIAREYNPNASKPRVVIKKSAEPIDQEKFLASIHGGTVLKKTTPNEKPAEKPCEAQEQLKMLKMRPPRKKVVANPLEALEQRKKLKKIEDTVSKPTKAQEIEHAQNELATVVEKTKSALLLVKKTAKKLKSEDSTTNRNYFLAAMKNYRAQYTKKYELEFAAGSLKLEEWVSPFGTLTQKAEHDEAKLLEKVQNDSSDSINESFAKMNLKLFQEKMEFLQQKQTEINAAKDGHVKISTKKARFDV